MGFCVVFVVAVTLFAVTLFGYGKTGVSTRLVYRHAWCIDKTSDMRQHQHSDVNTHTLTCVNTHSATAGPSWHGWRAGLWASPSRLSWWPSWPSWYGWSSARRCVCLCDSIYITLYSCLSIHPSICVYVRSICVYVRDRVRDRVHVRLRLRLRLCLCARVRVWARTCGLCLCVYVFVFMSLVMNV